MHGGVGIGVWGAQDHTPECIATVGKNVMKYAPIIVIVILALALAATAILRPHDAVRSNAMQPGPRSEAVVLTDASSPLRGWLTGAPICQAQWRRG